MELGQKFLDVMTRTIYQVVTIDDARIILETRDGTHQILIPRSAMTKSRSLETRIGHGA